MIGTGVLLAGLIGAWGAGRFTRDLANPVSVYVLVWSLSTALFLAEWVSYLPVQATLWWAVLLSFVGFLLGGWSALLWGMPKLGSGPVPAWAPNPDRFGRVILVFSGLGGLGLALQVHHLQTTMGLELLLEDPVVARRLHSNVPLWGYLNLLNVVNVPLCVMYFRIAKRFKPWMLATLIMALAAALLTTDRTRFFYTAIWSFFVWLYLPGRPVKPLKRLLGLGLVSGVLLLFFIGVGEHYDRKYRDRFPGHIHVPESLQVLIEPYIYLTGSLAALDALIEDENPMHLGKFSFSPLVSLAKVVFTDLETVPLQGKLYFVPMEVNTYSYLQQFYQDFGWWGILLGPYFCGWLSAWMYTRMRRRPTFFSVYAASLFSFCCVISVFVNTFTQEATWFFLGIGILVQMWLTRPINPPESVGPAP